MSHQDNDTMLKALAQALEKLNESEEALRQDLHFTAAGARGEARGLIGYCIKYLEKELAIQKQSADLFYSMAKNAMAEQSPRQA